MAVSVPLPHDLGHDDRLLLPEFCDLPLHHVVLTYLVQARGFSVKELGTLGILPALVAIPAGGSEVTSRTPFNGEDGA